MKKSLSALLPVLSVFVAAQAFAHGIWIEKDGAGAPVVRFGEYENDLRESGEKFEPFKDVKPAASGSGFVAEKTDLPVKDLTKYKEIGAVVKPHFYARWSSPDARPAMRLDAVESDGKARIYFDGQPVAGQKAVWIAPNHWTKELKTDEQGAVPLEMPWPGLYVLEVTRLVEKPGRYQDQDYGAERHRMTLSVEKK